MDFTTGIKLIKNELDKHDLDFTDYNTASRYVLNLLNSYIEHGHEVTTEMIIEACIQGVIFGKTVYESYKERQQ